MGNIEAIERLSKKYAMSPEEFIKLGSTLAMKEKKEISRLKGLRFSQGMKLTL